MATTHPLPAYGGIRLAESAIRQLADQLATGSVRVTFQHDSVRPVNCINVTAGVEKTEDGEFAAWIECDVDEDQWQLYDEECQAAGSPGGWSFSTVDPFASRGQQPYDMEIAGDASYFSDDLLLAAACESLPGELTITLGRLYQFSWIPDPKILIGIAQTTLTSIPANLLSSYLYDLARKFKAKLSYNSPTPTFEMHVQRQPRSKTTTIKITATDDYGLRQAMESVPEILRQEGKAACWDDVNHQWEEITTGIDEGDEPTAPFMAP